MPLPVVKQHDGAGYLISIHSYDTGGLRQSDRVTEYKGDSVQTRPLDIPHSPLHTSVLLTMLCLLTACVKSTLSFVSDAPLNDFGSFVLTVLRPHGVKNFVCYHDVSNFTVWLWFDDSCY